MTSKNNPNVTIVTGRVKIINNGFINRLRIINTAATTIAVRKPETFIPGKIFAKTTTAIAPSKISTIVFMDFDFCIGCKNKKNC